MAQTPTSWQLTGDYFENCNCDVVCPCLFSPNPPMTSQPTQGDCKVAFGFHIDHGMYGDVPLDGLNVALTARTPGPMANGDWQLVVYFDERANDQQRDALHAIFGGTAGGPMSNLAPLVGGILGAKVVPITFTKDGNKRAVDIPGMMHLGVHAAPSLVPDQEIWAQNAHPFAPAVAMAVGDDHSTWDDFGMHWDNSGKNGHYAPIKWSNA